MWLGKRAGRRIVSLAWIVRVKLGIPWCTDGHCDVRAAQHQFDGT
jgi:hypothetical protein